MQCLWKILTVITILVTIIESEDSDTHRSKRAHFDNFNVLLNLYKMNPLQKSHVYNSFLNHALLPNRHGKSDLNIDSNESAFNKTRGTLSVKQLENIINANYTNIKLSPPNFDVDNIDTEKFTIDVAKEPIKESSNRKEDFNSIFGHLESVEDDHIPVTKMLPVNNTNSVAMLNTNEIFESHNVKYGNVDKIFTVNDNAIKNAKYELPNDIGDENRNTLTDNGVITYK